MRYEGIPPEFEGEESPKAQEDTLEQKISNFELPNLSPRDMEVFVSIQTLFFELIDKNYNNIAGFSDTIFQFVSDLRHEFEHEEGKLKNCAGFYVLTGEEIPLDVTEADFEGRYSIEAFLKTLQ